MRENSNATSWTSGASVPVLSALTRRDASACGCRGPAPGVWRLRVGATAGRGMRSRMGQGARGAGGQGARRGTTRLVPRTAPVIAAVLLQALTGCSLVFTRWPALPDRPTDPVRCNESRVAPVLDTVAAGALLAAGTALVIAGARTDPERDRYECASCFVYAMALGVLNSNPAVRPRLACRVRRDGGGVDGVGVRARGPAQASLRDRPRVDAARRWTARRGALQGSSIAGEARRSALAAVRGRSAR